MRRFYFFPILTIFMIIMTIFVFTNFNDTKLKIKKDIFNDSLNNVDIVAFHISKYIYNNFNINKLKKDNNLKLKVDEFLESFISSNYKNIFIIYPKGKFFVALADGSKKDKFDFKEKFEPLNKQKFMKAFKTQKSLYFKQDIKGIWTTFLYPTKDYILVIDFSTKPVELVNSSLSILKSNVIVFMFAIFVTIVVLIAFILYDNKREKYLQKLIKELQILNATLEDRVKNEVAKNKQKDKQLELQSRMALMGELLSMIAHQWRQPLNALGGIVSNLKLDIILGNDNSNLEKILSRMEKIIIHLSLTIDDFRKFYREDNKLTEEKISKILDDSINIMTNSLHNNNISLEIDIKKDYTLKITPNRLKQVILNLIKNSSDVLKEKNIDNRWIKIDVFQNKNYFIVVKDNGGGIKDDIIDKIFDPYFTTKDEKNGTGIGLYMTKMIIEKMNGKVYVENTKDGAKFIIELEEQNGNK